MWIFAEPMLDSFLRLLFFCLHGNDEMEMTVCIWMCVANRNVSYYFNKVNFSHSHNDDYYYVAQWYGYMAVTSEYHIYHYQAFRACRCYTWISHMKWRKKKHTKLRWTFAKRKQTSAHHEKNHWASKKSVSARCGEEENSINERQTMVKSMTTNLTHEIIHLYQTCEFLRETQCNTSSTWTFTRKLRNVLCLRLWYIIHILTEFSARQTMNVSVESNPFEWVSFKVKSIRRKIISAGRANFFRSFASPCSSAN